MTEKIYLEDSYLKEFDAQVVRHSINEVVLNGTIFYPAGGGQPNDKGLIVITGTEYQVVDLRKEGDDIVHVFNKPLEKNVKAGDSAKCVIDWDYRYACMRYHSALHTLDGVIEKYYGSGMVTGGQIYHDRARLDIDMPGLSKEKALEMIDKTNAVAKEGHPINSRELSKEEAMKIPRLSRTETGRKLLDSLKTVRVIEIEGVDMQADGGLHVKNTGEFGKISLGNFENKGAKRKRMEIILI